MNFKSEFKEDLEDGQEGEKIIVMYLVCQGMKFLHLNNDYKYDIMMYSEKYDKEVSFEVKTDLFSKDTGNLAIEIRYKGKPSGISKTDSEWFVYWYRDLPFNNLWMIKVDDLKSLIKKFKFDVINGGDNNQSQLVIIPRKKYKRFFRVDTIKTKKITE